MTSRSEFRQGFTLIEVLASMTLGTMILLLGIAALGRSRDDYSRINGGVSAEREARAALTQLTADLHTARFHPDGVFEKSAAAWPLDRLGLLSLQPAAAQSTSGHIGDLCAIHYYLKDLVINGKTVRCLMRGLRESNPTFKAITTNLTPSLFTRSQRDEPIAFGVLAFEARPQSRNDSGTWQDWKASSGQAPAAVAIRLVIARCDLAAKLTTATAWDGIGPASGLLGNPQHAAANPRLEVYTSLVRFGNHAAL